jgi:hypothetical protein
MKFLAPAFLLASGALGHKLRGDCTSGGGAGCISPVSLDLPDKLNPATIVTTQDQNGFVSAQAIPGDVPDAGPEFDDGETKEDIALRFTISSPSLEPPPAAPQLITCDYDKCTTSTTTTPPR